MKKFFNTIAILSCFVLLAGCSGSNGETPEEGGKLSLHADKTSIKANGADKVTFTVLQGKTDVTSRARIYMIQRNDATVDEKQASAQFGSRTEGTFVFEARLDNNGTMERTESVTITATGKEEEIYHRNILGMYFTSIGCHNCPQMNSVIKNLDQKYLDHLVVTTFHTDFSGVSDPMTTSLTQDYMINVLYLSGLPQFCLDVRPGTQCYGLTTLKTTIENIENTLIDYPAVCGVKIESKYDASTKKVNVNFTVKAAVANEYRILPFIVEDGFVYSQAGADDNYVHDNVVRMSLASQLIGDRLGTIEKDAEATKHYSFNVKDGWNPDNLRVVVTILDTADGITFIGNNSAQCGINETIDYAYNQ